MKNYIYIKIKELLYTPFSNSTEWTDKMLRRCIVAYSYCTLKGYGRWEYIHIRCRKTVELQISSFGKSAKAKKKE